MKEDFYTIYEKELKSYIKPEKIILINLNSKNISEFREVLLKKLSSNNKKILYVSLFSSYTSLQKYFRDLGVYKNKIYVIDTITSLISGKQVRNGVIYIDQPLTLSELGLKIIYSLEKWPEIDTIVFDNVTNLLFYFDDKTIAKFFHVIFNKARYKKVNFIVLNVDDEEINKATELIGSIVDKVFFYNKQ